MGRWLAAIKWHCGQGNYLKTLKNGDGLLLEGFQYTADCCHAEGGSWLISHHLMSVCLFICLFSRYIKIFMVGKYQPEKCFCYQWVEKTVSTKLSALRLSILMETSGWNGVGTDCTQHGHLTSNVAHFMATISWAGSAAKFLLWPARGMAKTRSSVPCPLLQVVHPTNLLLKISA